MLLYCPARSDTRPIRPFIPLDATGYPKVAKRPSFPSVRNRNIFNEFLLPQLYFVPMITCDSYHGSAISFGAMISAVQPPDRGRQSSPRDLADSWVETRWRYVYV